MKFVFKPEYKVLPAGCDSQFHVISSVSVPADSNDARPRQPISMVLVIDNSGSMDGSKIEQTKNAILEVLHTLTRRDRLAIVTFASNVQTVYELELLTDKPTVANLVQKIVALDSTNLSGGWLKGLNQVEAAFDATHINRIFLLTDGQANAGVTDPAELVKIGQCYRDKGITTSTFGFGAGFNEALLKDIATHSGGNFYFVEKPEDISTAFRCEFGEVSELAGQNCEISFELPAGVEFIEDLSAFPLEQKKQVLKYNIGDITPELDHDIVFRVKTGAAFSRGNPALFKVKAGYNSVSGSYEFIKAEKQLKIKFAARPGAVAADEEVVDTVILAKCMKAKHLAYTEAVAGRRDFALKIIQDRETVILDRLEASMLADRDKLNLELEMLGKIKQTLNGGAADSGKTIKNQIEEYSKKRGAYLQIRKEKKYVVNTLVKATDTRRQSEIKNELAGALTDLGLESDFMRRCQVSFSELLSNAVEHGCKGIKGGLVKIMSVFRRGSAIIQVADPGRGFDYETALEKAKSIIVPATDSGSAADSTTSNPSERGRGLAFLLTCADEISYTGGGNEVQARLTNKAREGVISFDSSSIGGSNAITSRRLSVEIKNHKVGSNLVVEAIISGDMDSYNCQAIKGTLADLRSKGISNLILNIRNVECFDSSGLGFLVYQTKTCRDMGGRFVLSEPAGSILNILQLCKLDDFFNVCDNLNEALQVFAS